MIASLLGKHPGTRRREYDEKVLEVERRQKLAGGQSMSERRIHRALPLLIPPPYLDKTPDARPETVVRQLSPATGMRNGTLVENASDDVDQDRDEENDGEDAARTNTAGLVRLGGRAGVL